ncbi:MAG: UDP-3-O-[3-hydroxymyristoyl] N-acetylglucosamine deacetylase [Nitrospinae bacterium RIFCSPLOWO2_12_FULL_47_7]|nr:MAG: UDP-3-O-[3-hydroxymyristoyl] N-acetylglucosamine deacetylase [Nitrospinae bacterium RIFCSPLOWO2_12_FULL_47_7]
MEIIQSDPPDLVLLDIWLPGMDGIEVLKTVKTYYPEIEVLVMSGHGTIETAVKATKLGASNFIEKPFSIENLILSIESALKLKKNHPRKGEKDQRSDIPFCFEMMVEIKKAIKNASRNNRPVLVLGETGTGKELIVQSIHRQSKKSDCPLIKLNCLARPMQSIQSQLFGSQKSHSSNTALAAAGEKNIYLTNIDSLSKGLQEKLAQALKSDGLKKKDAFAGRLFASCTKDLNALVHRNQFNKTLYEILHEQAIEIPPLRQYAENIPALINTYFHEYTENGVSSAIKIDEEALASLCAYEWPGNIKELRSILEQILIIGSSRDRITLQELPPIFRRNKNKNGEAQIEEIKQKDKVSTSKPQKFRQRTLKRSVVLCGSGLHSGIKTGLILQPLPPGSGVIFGDISSGNTIPALLENIESTEYSTCLKKGASSVATIEHIMAVLHMYRITNLLIKIGDEAPVMDGSAKDFCQLIEDGEFEEQEDYCEEIVIDRVYSFGSKEPGAAFITIEPAERLTVSYPMDYPEPLGIQDFTYTFEGSESFKKEIAPARTFGFLEDVAQLTQMGFGTGGKLDNFILLGDGKVLNTKLRYENECVRHKVLDIIGDFYLMGKPIRGHIKARKSGHTQNIGLLNEINANLSF